MASLRSLLQYLTTFALRKIVIFLCQNVLLVLGQISTMTPVQRSVHRGCWIGFCLIDNDVDDEASF